MSEAKHCSDIFLFQKTLKKLRDIDDKIIYALNESTPTKSFQVSFVYMNILSSRSLVSPLPSQWELCCRPAELTRL